MHANDSKKNDIHPSENPASQPHGTTQDQINEMESEGQATKQGQSPDPSLPNRPQNDPPPQPPLPREQPGGGHPTSPRHDHRKS